VLLAKHLQVFQGSLVPPHLGNKLLGDVDKYLPINTASIS
jgi:hypothetical protein